ncbi:MAG: hypothetical protein J6A83_09285 [Clostridia bacterium]|nr:hypothetical protein [Clostridia bacterium]
MNNYDELLSNLQEELEEKDKAFERYIIVIPSDSSAELYCAAEKMMFKIGENTETDVILIYEHEKISVGKDDCEILIGDTSRKESQLFLRGYRSEDFGYGYSEGVIVVGGMNEGATLSAIEKFTHDVVNYADCELFMNSDKAYFYKGEYDVERATLNDFELCDYTLLYDKNVSSSHGVALSLRDALSERMGYYLRIKEKAELSNGARAIYIGDAANILPSISIDDNEAGIFTYPTGIALAAHNTFGCRLAAERFLSMLSSANKNGVAELIMGEDIRLSYVSSEISLLCVYPHSAQLNADTVNSILEDFRKYSANIISVYGVSENSATALSQAAGVGYVKTRICGSADAGVYHIYPSEILAECGIQSEAGAEGEIVTVRYRVRQTDAELLLLEALPADAADVQSAQVMAERIDGVISSESAGTVIVKSNFSEDVDAILGASLRSAERVNYYDGQKNPPTLPIYLSRDDCSVSDCEIAQTNTARYEYATVKLYDYKK